MIRRALFHWYFAKKRYAQALSCHTDLANSGGAALSSSLLHACYQLSLYRTVANSTTKDSHWRGLIARAVSLAVCGRNAEAAVLVREFISQQGFGAHRLSLAAALAPFAPALAFEVMQGCDTPPALHAALLLRLGQNEQAIAVLHQAMQAGQFSRFPDLNLLLSNAVPASPRVQLERMNAFLAAYALGPLMLLDDARSPGPTNLGSAVEYKSARGPLVSILMTAFNAAPRIVSAISSLQLQCYRNIEIIVVDDASTDDTGQVVQALAATDKRVVYIRLPCNVGTYVAKSIGLRRARGEFVTCHDSDDWSHPLRIERQVRPLIDRPEVVFTTSNWVRMQDDGLYYARPVNPLMRFNPASPMFRKDLVQKHAGSWDPVRTGADSEFAARLTLVFGERARHRVPQPLAFGAHRPGSLMTAVDTGYSALGISPTRLDYWESWGQHHIAELRAGRLPFVSPELMAERRFAAPSEIIVPLKDIAACLA